ncbi:MAG: 50S ribosomal protein L2 [Candidatus Pacebacteria bacterium]|nr:50S ribosomal protein L2 [Candidatus Paceibacterota bacterium]
MLKKRKPTTPGTRHQVTVDRTKLHKGKPEKSLLRKGHKKRQGRGYKGRITMRHRGGGVKKLQRIIDFKRNKREVPGVVKQIEYDPMRSANIALIYYKDGEKRYILAPDGLAIGDEIIAGELSQGVEVKPGNALPLRDIPVGMPIHNLELRPGKGGQIVRGAGTAATVQSKEGKYAVVALPSKEHRLINLECFATIGQVGNKSWKNRKIGKAGRKRLMGIRPTVRGTAQHPGSHPHGGGEGRSGVGLKYAKTPWGKIASPGKKTRRKNKPSDKWIVKDRRVKQ